MTEHTITDLMPKKDYLFRIRAETPNGDISAPTPPIAYYKSHCELHIIEALKGEWLMAENDLQICYIVSCFFASIIFLMHIHNYSFENLTGMSKYRF